MVARTLARTLAHVGNSLRVLFCSFNNMSSKLVRAGDAAFQKSEKCNAELFTLTYGVLVTQLLKDYENVDKVNGLLDKMGFNIGTRLVDELLAKAELPNACATFKDAADVVAKVGFKMFLGINADATDWNKEYTSTTIVIYNNPLTDFVELPDGYEKLKYCNIFCGVIRGALEQVRMMVSAEIIKDTLCGSEQDHIRVTLVEMSGAAAGDDYKED